MYLESFSSGEELSRRIGDFKIGNLQKKSVGKLAQHLQALLTAFEDAETFGGETYF